MASAPDAVVLTSCVGYSLRAWASRQLDASTLVLYNAAQPPLTALLGLIGDPSKQYSWGQAGGTAMVLVALTLVSGVCDQSRCRRHCNQATVADDAP